MENISFDSVKPDEKLPYLKGCIEGVAMLLSEILKDQAEQDSDTKDAIKRRFSKVIDRRLNDRSPPAGSLNRIQRAGARRCVIEMRECAFKHSSDIKL